MAIKIGNINVGNKLPMLLIAGPCVIESAGLAHDVAGSIAEITKKLGRYHSYTNHLLTRPTEVLCQAIEAQV